MKNQKITCIVSLICLLVLFPLNLESQELFTAKEETTVYKKTNKSDSIYTIHVGEKVEVIEIKKVWFKKWAKIQNSEGEQGYVIFNDLKPINVIPENKEDSINEELSTQNTELKELDSKTQNGDQQDSYEKSVNISNENSEKNLTSNNKPTDDVSQTNEHSKNSFPTWGWLAIIAIGWLIWKILFSNKSSKSTTNQNYNSPPNVVEQKAIINEKKTLTSTPATWKYCSTCEFWAGSRRPSHWRDRSEHESRATGECAGGGWNRSQKSSDSTCSSWKLWGVLKNN